MKRLFTFFLFVTIAITSLSPSASSPPQNFSVSVSGNSVSFSWAPSPASGVCADDPCTFSRYMLQQSGVGNLISVSSNRATTSFTLTGVPNGSHSFTLVAYYDIVTNPDDYVTYQSSTESVAVGGSVPPAPGNINALVNNSAIDVSWPAATGAATYQLQRNSADLVSVSAINYKDTSASPGVSYTYRVRACNAVGCSGWASSAPVTIPSIPAAPANITATPGSSSIQVIWSSSARTTAYELQRNSAALTSVATTIYTDSGAAINTAYVYRVRACNATGCSAWVSSPPVTIPSIPTAPANITATPGSSSIAVSWSVSAGTTAYELQRNSAVLTSVTTTSYIDSGAAINTSYVYRVRACNATGCSAWVSSPPVTIPPPAVEPTPPQNFSASASGGSVSFSWAPSPASGVCADDPCTFSRYMLQQSGVGNHISVSSNRATTSFTLTGVPNGSHSFTLVAYYDIVTNPDDYVTYQSSTVSVAVGGSVPPAPGNINGLINNSAIDVSWPAATGAATYQLQRSPLQGNFADLVSVSAINYKDTSALPGVFYSYRVRACNAIGCSEWVSSSPLSIPAIPMAPQWVQGQPVSAAIEVSWGNSYSGSAITHHELRRNSAHLTTVNLTSTGGSYQDATAVIGVTYTYSVRACNNTGCSSWVISPPVTIPSSSSSSSANTITTLYEAEDALFFKGKVATDIANFSGTGFVDYDFSVGSYVEWTINASAAGTATLDFRFGNGDAIGLVRPMEIFVNDISQGVVNFAGTGDWKKWVNQTTSVVLIAGVNKIRAVATISKGGPNVDYLNVTTSATNSSSTSSKLSSSSVSSSQASSPIVWNKAGFDPFNDDMGSDPLYMGDFSGKYTVDESGAFNYSIPLQVAPGINGMQPNLTMQYNSNMKNGLFGYGWSLTEASSSIARCNADLVRDGKRSAVGDLDDFKYCLNGVRLVEVSSGEFRLESDPTKKIVMHGGYQYPLGWSVYHADGKVYEYGNSNDSVVNDSEYYLKKKKDRSGNYVLYTYDNDSVGNTFKLISIAYTKSEIGLQGLNNEIVFSYEPRQDSLTYYRGGYRKHIRDRVSRISVKVNSSEIRHYLISYENWDGINYADPTKTSRISKVFKCDVGGYCPTIEFKWNELGGNKFKISSDVSDYSLSKFDDIADEKQIDDLDSSSFEQPVVAPSFGEVFVAGWNQSVRGDFDGDNKKELIWWDCRTLPNCLYYVQMSKVSPVQLIDLVPYRSHRATPATPGVLQDFIYSDRFEGRVADINGDGLDDFYLVSGVSGIRAYISNGSSLVLSNTYSVDPDKLRKLLPETTTFAGYNKLLIDVNGDGLLDLIKIPPVQGIEEGLKSIFTYFGDSGIYIALNTGSGFGIFSRWGTMSDYQTTMKSPFYAGTERLGTDNITVAGSIAKFGDVNGDGLVDVIGYLPDVGVEVGLNTGSSFVYKNNWADWAAPKVAHSANSNYGSWYMCPFSGQNWEQYKIYHYAHESFRYGDVNGDGLTDIVILTDKGISVSLSTGNSYLAPILWSDKLTLKQAVCGTLIFGSNGYWHRYGKVNWDLVDFNKDGRSDIGISITNTQEGISSKNHWEIMFSAGAENGSGSFSDPVRVYTNQWDINIPYAINQIGVSENGDPFIVKGKKAAPDKTYPYVVDNIYENIYERGMYRVPFDGHEIKGVVTQNGSSISRLEINYKSLNRNPSVYKESSEGSLKSTSFLKNSLLFEEGDVAGKSSARYDATKSALLSKNRAVNLLKFYLDGTQQYEIDYRYENYRTDKRGWGGLGFQKIESTTRYAERALVSSTEYLQEVTSKYALVKPRIATLTAIQLQTDTADSYRQLVSEERYTYKVIPFNDDIDPYKSPRFFPYVWSQETKNYDFDTGSLLRTTLFTSWNNASLVNCPQFYEIHAQQRLDVTGIYLDEFGTAYNSVSLQCNSTGVVGKRLQNDNVENNKSNWLIGLIKDPHVHSWVYESSSGLADSASRHTSYTFDEVGRVKTEIREPNSESNKKITITRGYNQYGSVNQITEAVDDFPNDGVTFTERVVKSRESYNSLGERFLETENALGHVVAQNFEANFGLEKSRADSNGLVTSYVYDNSGRLIQEIHPDNTKTNFYYRICSSCFEFNSSAAWYRQVKETGKASTRTYYDGANREVGSRSRGLSGEFSFNLKEYKSDGLLWAESQPFRSQGNIYKTLHYYDALGREVSTDYPNGGRQTIDYNSYYGAEAVTFTDSLGNKKSQQFDAAGREKVIVDSLGTATTYSYDALGNIKNVQVKGKNGESPISHSIKYDLLSRKTELNDPDVGKITYGYNAFGHLVSQTNAENETVKYIYDKLDRQITRIDPPSTTDLYSRTHTWSYDNKPNGVGLLGGVTGYDTQGRGFSEEYSYNNYSQLIDTDFLIDGNSYRISNVYDNFSRSIGLVYPTGFAVGYSYNDYGFNDKVVNAHSNENLWSAANDDSYGNITHFSFGNGASTQKAFSPDTGLIDIIRVTKASETIQDHDYDFDTEGNLRKRNDGRASITQNFCYDTLYRLTSSVLNQTCNDVANGNYSSAQYAYNIHGNITKKDNISDFRYGENAGPHAVTFANGKSYQYDKAGRMKGGTGRIIEYSAFGKPVYLSRDSYQTQIVYGPLEKRIRRMDIESGALTTTTYIDKLYEKIESPTGVEHRHYVSDFGIYVVDEAAQQSYNVYQHFDHIGSIAAKTDDRATSTTKLLANEPWGQRQDKTWNGQVYPYLTGAALKEMTFGTNRGFTGHEHLDAVGLIHMNGRVYDPVLGRFISPDPWIQDPKNSQSFNRYSYVWNNPLRYTDPTGEQLETRKIDLGFLDAFRVPNPYAVHNGDADSSDGGIEFELPETYIASEISSGSGGLNDFALENLTPYGYVLGAIDFVKDPSVMNAIGIVPAFRKADKVLDTVGDLSGLAKGVNKATDDLHAATPNVNTPADVKVDVDAPEVKNAIEEVANSVAEPVKEGIYEFTDTTGKIYCGQSCNISERIEQHVKSGKLDPNQSVTTTEVLGGKTAREIAEHKRIQEITGGVPARFSDKVSNKVDPIGPNRSHLLNE